MTDHTDIVFKRHQGQAITIEGEAPARTRISLHVLVDRYAYLHMPDPQTIVFADQVVYRITGYDEGTLTLELVEDWRPAPTVQLPSPTSRPRRSKRSGRSSTATAGSCTR